MIRPRQRAFPDARPGDVRRAGDAPAAANVILGRVVRSSTVQQTLTTFHTKKNGGAAPLRAAELVLQRRLTSLAPPHRPSSVVARGGASFPPTRRCMHLLTGSFPSCLMTVRALALCTQKSCIVIGGAARPSRTRWPRRRRRVASPPAPPPTSRGPEATDFCDGIPLLVSSRTARVGTVIIVEHSVLRSSTQSKECARNQGKRKMKWVEQDKTAACASPPAAGRGVWLALGDDPT